MGGDIANWIFQCFSCVTA